MDIDRIPDPIELGERRVESWVDENMNDNQFKCPCCKTWVNHEEMNMLSPDPYALPICNKCFLAAIEE